jgi:branched-subunit amino acid ABC-type transport system permease component
MRITLTSVAVLSAFAVVAVLSVMLWKVLGVYIHAQSATERKYIVQSFVIVVAGGAGLLIGAVWSGFSAYHAHAGAYGSGENSKSGAPKRTRCQRTWIRWFDC